jgi:hypothetical protein
MLCEGFPHASWILYHLTVDFIRLLGSFLQFPQTLAASAEGVIISPQLDDNHG